MAKLIHRLHSTPYWLRVLQAFSTCFLVTIAFLLPTYVMAAVALIEAERMVRLSDNIVVATVTGQHVRWNDRHNLIVTDYEIIIERQLKGTATEELILTVVGGSIDGETHHSSISVHLEVGARYILFLADFGRPGQSPFTGSWQGVIREQFDQSGKSYPTIGPKSLREIGNGSSSFEEFIEILLSYVLEIESSSTVPDENEGMGSVQPQLPAKLYDPDFAAVAGDSGIEPIVASAHQPPAPSGEPKAAGVANAEFRLAVPAPSPDYVIQGAPPLPVIFEALPLSFNFSPNDQYMMAYWNVYQSGLFRVYSEPNGTWAFGNGVFELAGFPSNETMISQFGRGWGSGELGVTFSRTVNGTIVEADIALNPAFGWTLNNEFATRDNNSVWGFEQTMLHELGYSFGLQHPWETQDVWWDSVMNYAPKRYRFPLLHADDTSAVRAVYPGTVIHDGMVTFHETHDDSGSMHAIYDEGDIIPNQVAPGDYFDITDLMMQNAGSDNFVNPTVDIYLTPIRMSWSNAHYLDSKNYPFTLVPHQTGYFSALSVFVPQLTPPGSYYVGIVLRDEADGYISNNSAWSAYDNRITVVALPDLIFSTSFEAIVTNKPPIANAGTDQQVYGGGDFPATLVGERSTDFDGSIVSVSWAQLSGPDAVFGIQSGLNIEYFPPVVDADTELIFELTVHDDGGATDTDTVTITVLPSQMTILLEADGGSPVPPRLLLFDPDGNLQASESTSGSVINKDFQAGAGVIYAVATAESQVDMLLSVTRQDGKRLESLINSTQLNLANQAFLTGDDFADDPARYLVFGHVSSPDDPFVEISFPAHPQIIEIALSHPDPGLRDSDRFLSFLNRTANRYTENAVTAEAYYRAVDPFNNRTTLDDWLEETGFKDGGADAHAVYKNDADLGFGRDMYMRKNPDGTFASYVRNFPSLDHALANEKLIATVTMEHSPANGHPENFTKFFVFGPDGERLSAVDLDGRGAKFVPGVCNVCHGGAPGVTFENGSGVVTYPDNGDTLAQFLPWDLDTFIYSIEPGLTRADQEQQLYELNQLAKATYPASPGDYRWTGATATELINGWYIEGQVFKGDFVPSGWAGQEDFYLDIVGPNCRACHITRGTNRQNAIDFSSYEKFMGYAPLIRELVYNQGVMPLAVRTFGHFWKGGSNSPAAKLAVKLKTLFPGEFDDLVLADNDARKPGRPIARTGMAMDLPPEVVQLQDDSQGVITLDGRDSLFTQDQDWRVVSSTFTSEQVTPSGNSAETKPGDNDDGSGSRLARQIAPPAAIKRTLFSRTDLGNVGFFSASIADELKNNCSGCHNSGTPNMPVYFDIADPDVQYQAVLNLVNFEQPSQSLILTKPGGLRHGANGSTSVIGNARPNFAYFGAGGEILPMSDRGSFAQLISRWIQVGAPE